MRVRVDEAGQEGHVAQIDLAALGVRRARRVTAPYAP